MSPAYNTQEPPQIPVITPGQRIVLWDNETPAAGEASQQCMFSNSDHFPKFYSVQFGFSANPGAFSLVLEHSDTDEDGSYVAVGDPITEGLNASFNGRIEMNNVVARYVRLVAETITNAVSLYADIGK